MTQVTSEVKQIELDLWTALRDASADPIAAEFPLIWQALDKFLPSLSITHQLETASHAIAQVTDIFEVQAGLIFEALEARATLNGPTMAEDAFDRYVRQSMEIDFEPYIEAVPSPERQPRTDRSPEDEFYSQVKSIDKTELIAALHEEILLSDAIVAESAMSVAHREDISVWIELIRSQLGQMNGATEFQYLLAHINLEWVELWLGLLLGGYKLSRGIERFQKPEDFYSLTNLWIN